jgi:ribosomal protein RSM22 (predicted rRNA methylase)
MSQTDRLPQDLFAALESRLNLAPLAALRAGYADLSRDYRIRTVSEDQRADLDASLSGPAQGGRAPGGYTRAQARSLAYLAARFPATYAAVSAALAQIPDAALEGCSSVLDVGAGPGTASWALGSRWPGITSARLLESNAEMLGHAAALAGAFPAMQVTLHSGDLAQQLKLAPPCDLVVIAYVLSELPESEQAGLLGLAWEKARRGVFLLEPGTPETSRRMLAARAQWIASGGSMVAPCPQAGICPMDPAHAPAVAVAGSREAWCHFSVRLQRRGLHKAVKGGALAYEDEKYCWVYVSKNPGPPSAPFRLHSDPHRVNRNISLDVCDADGKRRPLFYKRRETSAAIRQAARQLRWGDGWDPGSVAANETKDDDIGD